MKQFPGNCPGASMSSRILDNETIGYIRFFEDITSVPVMDCIVIENKLVFIIEGTLLGAAIGKRGRNVSLLKNKIGKVIDIIGYSESPETFIKNIFHNYRVEEVKVFQKGQETHAIVCVERSDKGRAIGRDGCNLKMARTIVNRHYKIDSIKVQ